MFMKRKRLIGLLLTLAMLLTLIPVFALAGPQNNGLIAFYDGGRIGMVPQEQEHGIYSSQLDSDVTWCEQHGISYDLESNTLTLNNVDLTSTENNSLYIVRMGEDFKINVSGNCKIKGQILNLASYSKITIYSQNNGCLELDGFEINNTSEADPANIQIENNVTVKLNTGLGFLLKNREDTEYSPEKMFTYKGKSSQALVFKDYGSMMGCDHIYTFNGTIVFSPTVHEADSAVVAISDYVGPQPSLNGGDDIFVAMTEPDPSTIKSAGIQTYEDGTQYYLNEITEPLNASEDQVFALNITGSDVNNVDENNPAPANSFAIYNSNVFSEENLVATIENGMKDAHGTQIGENAVEPANAGGSGMLLMAAPLRAKAAEPTGYNVSVTIPAGILEPEKTYYFVIDRDMVTNEEDANTTNTDIVFKFTTGKVPEHEHTAAEAVRENEVSATCTQEGSYDEVVYCTECEEEISREHKTVDKLQHKAAAPVKENEVAATCTKEGSYDEVVYCSECGEKLSRETKTIEKIPHNYENGSCTVCGAKDPSVPDPSADDLDPSVNGIVKCPDGVRWAMYKNGKVDTTCTTIAQNQYGWWRVENGYVNFDAQGIYQNKYGWWKTTDGKVTFKEFGLFENENGTWRVEFSKVNFLANGIYKGKDGWYKTTNGKVTFDETGIFQNQFGWWYCKNSKVDFDFTGVASNQYGKWYVKSGKVDFTKLGFVKYDGKTYTVMFGKVLFG